MQKLILLAVAATLSPPPLPTVSPAELKGDLSFLASDELQGRFTPSPGLDVAAAFIASKFRAAGLEPGGDSDYFQTVEMVERHLPKMATGLTLTSAAGTVVVPAAEISVDASNQAVHLEHLPVLILLAKDEASLNGVDLRGKAVVAPESARDEYSKGLAFDQLVAKSGAALAITIVKNKRQPRPARLMFTDQTANRPPVLAIQSEAFAKPGEPPTLSVDIPAPTDNKVTLKNVIGILRGSDPALSKTAVLLTAHYDHIGTAETAGQFTMRAPGDSLDRIYNGANDDGSGTVSVIEIARAIAKIRPRPKRSIVFMTFFGEERGEFGSKFYGQHPVFPIAKTVADVNLEQVGRTDSTVGPQLNNASVTGYDYSEVTQFLKRAGERVGIKVYRDPEGSDAYFTRSDNDALAEQGVPAHTLCVAFDFPDYHGAGDEWQKINYENMAKVDRMVLLGLLDLANSVKPPEWNAKNPKTEPFRKARAASREHP